MANRIDDLFSRLKAHGAHGARQKAFVAYIVAGDPGVEQTVELVLELEKAGVDVIELGIPFSDPLADGMVNQLGSQRALAAGTTPLSVLQIVRDVRRHSAIPLVLFTYYNPLYKHGLTKYLETAEAAGVDGLLILDLPMEEAHRYWPKKSSLRLISLIAPTTPPDRVKKIAGQSSGFIYYVSREGVTGMQSSLAVNLSAQVGAIKAATPLPVCVGFGISTPAQAAEVAKVADGVVVGSAIVDQIGKHGAEKDFVQKVTAFVRPLVEATKQV